MMAAAAFAYPPPAGYEIGDDYQVIIPFGPGERDPDYD